MLFPIHVGRGAEGSKPHLPSSGTQSAFETCLISLSWSRLQAHLGRGLQGPFPQLGVSAFNHISLPYYIKTFPTSEPLSILIPLPINLLPSFKA